MKLSATTLLLAAVLGASAHPSAHAHKHAHRSLEERADYFMAKKPSPDDPAPAPVNAQVPASSSPVPPPPAYTPEAPKPGPYAPVPAPASAPGSGKGVGSYTPFCGGNSKRATVEQIAYKGNVGSSSRYGCNLMLVQSSIADKYAYTANFTNAGKKDQSCICWLKIGPDGGINGFFNGNEVLTFNLPPGGQQVLAADSNSQGGCTCQAGSVATDKNGEFASSWLEFDFGNQANNNWSGADASCLVAARAGLPIPGLNVCGQGKCSTINPGGATGTEAYLGGMEDVDGAGIKTPTNQLHLQVTVDYQGGSSY